MTDVSVSYWVAVQPSTTPPPILQTMCSSGTARSGDTSTLKPSAILYATQSLPARSPGRGRDLARQRAGPAPAWTARVDRDGTAPSSSPPSQRRFSCRTGVPAD